MAVQNRVSKECAMFKLFAGKESVKMQSKSAERREWHSSNMEQGLICVCPLGGPDPRLGRHGRDVDKTGAKTNSRKLTSNAMFACA